MQKQYIYRSGIVLIGFLIFYALVISKLFYWQVVKASDLKEIRDKQSTDSLVAPAIRGEIKTSDSYPLATNTISYLLYSNPKVINDKETYAKDLAPLLKTDQASISALLKNDVYWITLSHGVSQDTKKAIENLNLKGVGFQEETIRLYPEASMAAHLVGFVGKKDDGSPKGFFGIEGYYDTQLQGRSGKLSIIRDALGNQIVDDIREEKKIDGRNLTLTVDRYIQYIASKRLGDGVKKYGADGGTVIVMEPATGKILAMSSFPRFDPHKYYEYPYDTYKNPAITDLYEPGSTFKVLIMAAGIDAGKVKPDTVCSACSGPVQIGEYSIKTWDDKYFPNSTMTDVIIHSDNTGMVFVGKKMGLSLLLSYFKRFGIGETTGIDLQGENSGYLRPENSWYPIDLATTTFGQGITVTPLELLDAVSSIANGGNLMRPFVVSKIQTEEGREIEIKPQLKKRTVSQAAAKAVSAMMVQAVEKGEAQWVKIKGYDIAGKTGTAQIPVAGHYDPHQTIASFVGFFPAKDPKISMLVLINKPKTSIYGAETAAPIFFSIAQDLINYLGLAPER